MRIRKAYLALALPMALSLACNTLLGGPPPEDAGSSATPPVDGPPEAAPADFYDVDGNPVMAEPQPVELVDLMLEQVEAGEISQEQAVLDLLRMLAGEAGLPAYADQAGTELVLEGVWALTGLAHEVYNKTQDPAVQQELERLMRVLAPSREAMAPYAAPAESLAVSSPGQRGLQRQITCDQIWHAGFPESAGPAPTCVLYKSVTAGGAEFRVYYPEEMSDDTQAMAYVSAAHEALIKSQETYSHLVDVRSVDIVFSLVSATDIGGPENGKAMVPGFGPGELGSKPCPITVFQGGGQATPVQFQQVIAHEVFHCIHLWRKGVSGVSDASWYNEGMANYFSNVVYPQHNREHQFVGSFHQQSPTHSILDMDYENTVFFQYLGGRLGNEWLIQFLDGMPTTSKSDMMVYMWGLEGFDQIFHEFGQAYVQGMIADTGGGFLPGKALILPEANISFPDPGEYQLEARPFHVERARYEFEQEHQIDLVLDLEGDGAIESANSKLGSSWAPMPAHVVACPDSLNYLHILTTIEHGSTSSTAATFDISVANEEETDCDSCLVGVWEHVIPLSDYWDAVRAATANQSTKLDSVSGLRTLTFYEGGLYESVTEDFKMVWRSVGVGGNITSVQTTVQHSAIGSYVTIDGTLLQLIEEDESFRQEDVTVVSGPLGTFSSDPVVTSGGPGYLPPVAEGAPYTCTDTTLRYFHADPNYNWSGYVEFDRLTSDPSDMIGP